ncbi:protein AKNAD1 [Elgaria multicarinata webbii]|uniref:protein AKNAD1 n=1 Tax=Elgaria multicarinata webbii TaxID=159646 RepID=UPI002FCD41C1
MINNILFGMLYPEDNTDDEQEDLPYDGDLQNRYQFCDSQNVEDFPSVENTCQSGFTLTSCNISHHSKEKSDCKSQLPQRKINLASFPKKNDMEFTTEKELLARAVHSSGRNEKFSNSKISDVLLRHFPKEELSNPCQLIDSETIPEISFTESFDETILNKIKISDNTRISSPQEERGGNLERGIKSESVEKNWDLIQDKQFAIDESFNPGCDRKDCKQDNPQFLTQKNHATDEELSYMSTSKEEYQEQKYFLETTGSSHNLKYGQRQVHYRLPDFSKVAPKVKIPKGNNDSSTKIKQTKSFPNVLGNSATKTVLEAMNSLESVAIKNQQQEMSIAELDRQLEMLTKQAEAQNHIDHLRFNAKVLPCSNSHKPNLSIKAQGTGITSEMSIVPPVTVPVKIMLGFSQLPHSDSYSRVIVSPLPLADVARQSSVNPPVLQKVTEEEKLSQMLKDQTKELKAKVEIFSKCMTQDVLPAQERHQLLMLLREQLDQLEQNYLSTKEKHCALHLRNYEYSSTSTREFDPHRKVEGEIFKLGMLLEDIKEKIDKTCNPHSSTFVASSSFKLCESVSSSNSSCTEHCFFSPNKTPKELQSQRYQNADSDQENTDGNLSYWEMRSPPPAKPYNTNNQETNTARFTVLKEKGSSAYPADHHFCEELGNSAKEHNIIIHPRLKIQLTSKQTCSCSSSRNKKMEYKKTNRGKSDCERFSIFLEEKAMDLDLSGSDMEDTSFCDHLDSSSSEEGWEQWTKNHESWTVAPKEQNKDSMSQPAMSADLDDRFFQRCCSDRKHLPPSGSTQKETIALQKICTNKEPEQFIDRLCDRQNQHIPQTRYSRTCDTIILSPQYLPSRSIYGRRSTCNLRNRDIEDTNTKILNSTLDHVIQTANNLKKTSEHMMQVVSEDLAKAKIQPFDSVPASR